MQGTLTTTFSSLSVTGMEVAKTNTSFLEDRCSRWRNGFFYRS